MIVKKNNEMSAIADHCHTISRHKVKKNNEMSAIADNLYLRIIF